MTLSIEFQTPSLFAEYKTVTAFDKIIVMTVQKEFIV